MKRIQITDAASQLLKDLKATHGELMFHQSGGCCDGSSPMCFTKGEFKLGSSDVCLGSIDDCEFWMSRDQFEYWKHTKLTVDVVKGRGSSFSLEIPSGFRFMIRSELFTAKELNELDTVRFNE